MAMNKVSNSRIQCFKACRRMYELRYIHGLVPIAPTDAQERGLSYHAGIEDLLKNQMDYKYMVRDIDNPKIRAMVMAFNVRLLPKFSEFCVHPTAIEQWFSYQTASGHEVIGRLDGVVSGHRALEHKSTSGAIDGAYLQRLEFDEQIGTYMLATGSNEVFYSVCATPTIRQKKSETDEEFYERCFRWYDEDTDSKIALLQIRKDKEQLKQFAKDQDSIIGEMEHCKLFYRNPSHCMKWGRMCEYAQICLQNVLPDSEYIGFRRREQSAEAGEQASQVEERAESG